MVTLSLVISAICALMICPSTVFIGTIAPTYTRSESNSPSPLKNIFLSKVNTPSSSYSPYASWQAIRKSKDSPSCKPSMFFSNTGNIIPSPWQYTNGASVVAFSINSSCPFSPSTYKSYSSVTTFFASTFIYSLCFINS